MKTILFLTIYFIMFCNSAFSQTEIENVNDIIAEATKGEFLNREGIYDAGYGNGNDGTYTVDVIDLNKDGQPEVLVNIQSSIFGMVGNSLELFIKDRSGVWQPQFGFPGIPYFLETGYEDFPDIEIGGPGFCFPVWRWNGEKYDLFKKCPDNF